MWKITKLEFIKKEFPRIFKMILNAVSLILKILEKNCYKQDFKYFLITFSYSKTISCYHLTKKRENYFKSIPFQNSFSPKQNNQLI